ncbi:AAA family ATPase [Weissella confusa]|uniref:AAA family ATPase n=1 Tax=Weissella confusa TaxID=1583 RepID=UPI0022FDE76B|nr:AAA family ATPase [Weissella confusa]MDA5457669.1 Translation-disabling ACNase RloC [Weissella confusa]
MTEITIDLKEQHFEDGIRIFKDDQVLLNNKNFIFARNGSGKSTFSKLIADKYSEDFDVRLFAGFDELLGENTRLDAFALAVDAGSNEKLILEKEKQREAKNVELQAYQKDLGIGADVEEENLQTRLTAANTNVEVLENQLTKNYRTAASQIKRMTDPQIAKTSYDINNFQGEIDNAKKLSDDDINIYKQTIKSDPKNANIITWTNIDLAMQLENVNEIITSAVHQRVEIPRLKDDPKKTQFAKEGLEIHNHIDGEICAFCGNPISPETFFDLQNFFSSDEIAVLQQNIEDEEKRISDFLIKLSKLNFEKNVFYPEFSKQAEEQRRLLEKQVLDISKFFETLLTALESKKTGLFSAQDTLKLELPDDLDLSTYNKLVVENTKYGQQLANKQQEARDFLRLNKVAKKLEEFGYSELKAKLHAAEDVKGSVKKIFEAQKNQMLHLQSEIDKIDKEIEDLEPKAEEQAVNNINLKLKSVVSWQIAYADSSESGYYRIEQQNDAGSVSYRGVGELSTGEKNIIAFLYFMERLAVKDSTPRTKIIIFDDPMNSNDATMQYLIITELQKLYGQKKPYSRDTFDPSKDYFVLLTHNVHFYLNVPPMGNYEDNKGRTKYDKNNFYFIQGGKFVKITSSKQDLKNSYDSLWSELKALQEHGFSNSMLNSMRRIIQTYLEFTGTEQDTFYQNNAQYLKLFNVNSHSATDDVSTQAFSETPAELVALFKGIFEDNGVVDHFNAHWKD